MSVLVPLSMFATDSDAFRAQFLEERGKRFVRFEDAITKGKSPARTPLSKWRVTRILPASVQSELGRWQEDYNAERERQSVAWPNPTSLTVDFPEGVLARYKAMKELAPTTARARATVLFCARARKWNGFSRKVERSSQLMERLMAHEFSQNGTALAPIWNDPLSNRDAPVILSQWNGNP